MTKGKLAAALIALSLGAGSLVLGAGTLLFPQGEMRLALQDCAALPGGVVHLRYHQA